MPGSLCVYCLVCYKQLKVVQLLNNAFVQYDIWAMPATLINTKKIQNKQIDSGWPLVIWEKYNLILKASTKKYLTMQTVPIV